MYRIVNNIHPKSPQLLVLEVSHSRELMFSGIHVYSACDILQSTGNDGQGTTGQKKTPGERKLVALAHSLDPNTLPSPQMLKKTNLNWQVKNRFHSYLSYKKLHLLF